VLFHPWIWDPDPGTGWKKIRIWIWDEHPRLFFREVRNSFLVKNAVLKFLDADPDPGSEIRDLVNPGPGIRDGKKSDGM
jgi:hypothetical protein